jgi:hypothetical protein
VPVGTTVLVRGVVTVAPGWILGDSTLAIQDATGGIYVKLPAMSTQDMVPGRILQVQGTLASPYQNLEIRPAATGVQLLETAQLPTPAALSFSQLGETTEGLLAHVSGDIIRIEGGTTGSLTLILEDASGQGRVFAHAPLGIARDDYRVGQTISVIGLVGDRLGLYRLWPRNQFDISVITDEPTPSPSPSSRPTPTHRTPPPVPTPRHTPSARPSGSTSSVSISEALRRQGQTVTVEGVATTRNGLLDGDGQRVTIQDPSAAILVRLPEGVTLQVGQSVRVTGPVGTYYGAPQLTATVATRLGDANIQAVSVRAAPLAAALEWRLVTVSGQVESVHRDGDTWRAELLMTGGGIPIAGLSRSGIESTALLEGRTATIVGIVKRAYPTASDQRFAVVPRTTADIRLAQAGSDAQQASNHAVIGGESSWSNSSLGAAISGASPIATDVLAASAVLLADLAAYEGVEVSVGGVVINVDGIAVTIDDGTETALVRLPSIAAGSGMAIQAGDLLNVRGLVLRNANGELEIVVADMSAVEWLDRSSITSASGPVRATASRAPGLAPINAGPSSPQGGIDARVFAVAVIAGAAAVITMVGLASPAQRKRLQERFASARTDLRKRLTQLRSS